jgi:N-acyl-phosphatidylethanolamine-hydrolysing phospholipase D
VTFINPGAPSLDTRFSSVLKWKFVDRPKRQPPAGPTPRAQPAFVTPRGRPGVATVTWIGHSSFLVQLGAVNILTDPMWSDRASPVQWAGPKRLSPPGLPIEGLPPIDLVVQSHNHYDHLDDRTVRRLARAHPEARWAAPLGVGSFLRERGARHVTEHNWWDEIDVAGLRLSCAPAQHFSGRGLRDRNQSLWCGWALRDESTRVYFCGDSGYHGGFTEIGRRLGPFDIALMPVGAYDPRWFMKPVHMDPEESVTAFRDLHRSHDTEAKGAFVPMHWGTFRLTDEPVEEPPALAREHWRRADLPGSNFWLLALGETKTR